MWWRIVVASFPPRAFSSQHAFLSDARDTDSTSPGAGPETNPARKHPRRRVYNGAWSVGVADNAFENPRLAALYDHLEGRRKDLEVYVAIADELGARRVLDVGCGTGTLAFMLASRGLAVTGVDPAQASLEVARAKTGAERVRWIHGDATTLPALQVDLTVMTGNVAQAIVAPSDWDATLRGIYQSLRPGGYLVFETRDPAREAWKEWNRPGSLTVTNVPGVGAIESWYELVDVTLPLVSFRWTVVFPDATVLKSDSTLRFCERIEVENALRAAGYSVIEVRDAPDRPGREFVFFARRPDHTSDPT